MPREGGSEEPALLTNELVPPKSSEGHRRNRRTRGGFPRAVTLGWTQLCLPFARGAKTPRDPLRGGKGWRRNLLQNGGFISASPSRAPCQGHAPCLSLARREQDEEGRGVHMLPHWGHPMAPVSPRIPGLPPRLLPSPLRSLSPLAKTSSRTIGESLGIFTN